MKKTLWIIVFSYIAFLFVACDNGNKGEAFYQQWEGEYMTKQSVEYVYADGSTDKLCLVDNNGNPLEYPIQDIPFSIFRDDELYVQMYYIGNPYIPGKDSEEHLICINENDKYPVDSAISFSDAGVYTVYHKRFYSPNPIKVKRATTDKLFLENGEKFYVEQKNQDGSVYDVYTCYWTYEPIQKQNEILTWEAKLHTSSRNKPGQMLIPVIYRHNIVIYKK